MSTKWNWLKKLLCSHVLSKPSEWVSDSSGEWIKIPLDGQCEKCGVKLKIKAKAVV